MAIPALVVLAGDGSAKQKEYAANALGNLAADPALLERVVTPQKSAMCQLYSRNEPRYATRDPRASPHAPCGGRTVRITESSAVTVTPMRYCAR